MMHLQVLSRALYAYHISPHAQDVPMECPAPNRFPSRREERLHEDNQLLGIVEVGGGDDSSNRASRMTASSVGEFDVPAPAEPLGSRSPSPSAAFYGRPYEENEAVCARTAPDPRCVETVVDYPDPDAWPISCSRSLGAVLTIVLSVVAWWGVHSVTPEPPTTMEWIMRKIGYPNLG